MGFPWCCMLELMQDLLGVHSRVYFPRLIFVVPFSSWAAIYNHLQLIYMTLPAIIQCVLTLSCAGIIFKGFHNFDIFTSVVFSHPIDSCSMVALTNISSSDFIIPLSTPLGLINTVYALDTSVATIFFIHIIKLLSCIFLSLVVLGKYSSGSDCGFPKGIGPILLITLPIKYPRY